MTSLSQSYYPVRFAEDLDAVLSSDMRVREVSICSFLPDYPRAPFFADPARRWSQLYDRDLFLAAAFWEILADQAVYTLFRCDLRSRTPIASGLKLVGLLATILNNIHPAHLLVAASFDRTIAESFSKRLGTLGHEVLTVASNALGQDWDAVRDHMLGALEPGAVPNSIRAYVPNGDRYPKKPDWSLVEEWRQSARVALSGSVPGLANER